MGIEQRRQRERDEVREKILDAARELFVECGYEGVSMRKVAERIEYSPTTIYLHFADKEALFRDLCSTDFLKLATSFQSVTLIQDPVERIRACGQVYTQFAIEHPNHYRLMFMTPHPLDPSEEELNRKGNPNEDAYEFFLQIVLSAIDAGVFRPQYKDPHLLAQTLWAAVHGVVSLEIAQGCETWINWVPIRERVETMLDGILRGLVKVHPNDEELSPGRPANLHSISQE